MEEKSFRETLEKFRVDIVQTLDLQRQFIFCHLRSESVLDEEDCERILEAGAGRQQKVAKFLDVLACKGPEGYQHFLQSLEIEYPNLYEKMTGKRAVKRSSKKDSFDFDREYLAAQLEKTTSDLHVLTYVHNKMHHEKSQLERKIMETVGDLENEQIRTKELREEMMNISTETLRGNRKSAESLQPVQQYVQELIAENADKSNIIISLQQTLLTVGAKAEQDKRTIDELQQRQEALLQQIRDLTINYDWERRNSRKMGEKICRQNDQIRQGDDLRREIFELKLKLSEMQEQRDDAREELREFRNVTEALNAKFDTVRKEKELAIGIKENFTGTVLELDEQVQSLQLKLRRLNLDYKELERKFTRQGQEIATLREHRDVLLKERQVAIQERIAACKERDEALKMNQDLQNSRDTAIEAQIKINNAKQHDYTTLAKEMEILRYEYSELVKQFESAQQKLEQGGKENRLAPYFRALSAPMQGSHNENLHETVGEEKSRQDRNEESPTKNSSAKEYPWKTRSNSSVLNSAYRRINETKIDTYSKHRSSVPLLYNASDQEMFESVIGPYRIKDKQKNNDQPDCIYFSVDDAENKPRDSKPITADGEAKKGSSDKEAKKESLEVKIASNSENVNRGASLLSVNGPNSTLRRSKALSAPPSPNNRHQKDAEVLSCIVPCISDFSVKLAMKSGSQESLSSENTKQKTNKIKNEKTASVLVKSAFMTSGLLAFSEPKQTEVKLKSSGKSVAPKLLYKVDKDGGNDSNLQCAVSKNDEKQQLSQKSSSGSLKVINKPRRHSTSGLTLHSNGPKGFSEV